MASAAEKFVTTVRELSATQGSLNNLCNFISKSFDGLMKSPVVHLDNALETLLPDPHSLGILAILLVKFKQLEIIDAMSGKKYYSVEPADLEKLLAQTDTFIQSCDVERISCASDSYNEVMHRLSELLIHRKEAERGIPIIVQAIQRIRTNDSELTGIHSDLCHLCLAAKLFKPALPFLDEDITDMQKMPTNSGFDSTAFLLYYYYGGMIYTVEKNFKRAAFFFEIAISTPSSAVSAVMVESYKKYVLTTILATKVEPTFPKFMAPVLARHVRHAAIPYQELGHAYASSLQSTLQATVDKHKPTYEKDKNFGLVKQCMKALYRKNIQKLTKTFLTLSLTDVANRVNLSTSAEAEKYLIEMIEDGEIFATVNKKDGMVEFHDNPEKYNNPQMLKFLQRQGQTCMAMNSKLREFERLITVTPEYVSKMAAYSGEDDNSLSKPSSTMVTS